MAADRWSRLERELRSSGSALIAGIDEVGRGPLAGPVVACALVMPPDKRAIAGVNDSKQLHPERREELAVRIRTTAIAYAVGAASVREIDRINIYHATVATAAGEGPHHVLIDGNNIRTLGYTHTAIVKGDARCYNIACASILAKVTRDRLMKALASRYDGYGWTHNVGYATREHRQALDALGLTPHHRRSFCMDAQTELDLDADAVDDNGENIDSLITHVTDA